MDHLNTKLVCHTDPHCILLELKDVLFEINAIFIFLLRQKFNGIVLSLSQIHMASLNSIFRLII